ncbi:MAG TPA: hypothetical protein VFH70_01575 [Acidimicrobiales bacterium]|nr:hypothetical protein [Acidimicrobiales bacterium]
MSTPRSMALGVAALALAMAGGGCTNSPAPRAATPPTSTTSTSTATAGPTTTTTPAPVTTTTAVAIATSPTTVGPTGASVTAASQSLPPGDAVTGMACGRVDECFATVTTTATAPGGPVGRLMSWDGHSWNLLPSTPGTSTSAPLPLAGVACSGPSNCMAVGGSGGAPISLHWNGGQWSRVTVPAPVVPTDPVGTTADRPTYVLTAVSCPSGTECVAVGVARYRTVDTPNNYMFASLWTGSAWSSLNLGPGDDTQELDSVSCPARNECVAVGVSRHGVEGMQRAPLIEQWNGRAWSGMSIATPASTYQPAELDGVSCPTTTWCMAVGVESDPGSGATASSSAAFTFAGGSWTATSRAPGVALSGVSCEAASQCTAVGGVANTGLVGAYHRTWASTTPRGPAGSSQNGPLRAIAPDGAGHYQLGGYQVTGTADTTY